MSHFRITIRRNTLMIIGCIFLMAGCVPEPLLDDSTADARDSSESDATWDEDSWWDSDTGKSETDVIDGQDQDTEFTDSDIPGEEDVDELPGAENPAFVVVADTLRNSCGSAGCHGIAPQGDFQIPGGMNATNSQVRQALEGNFTKHDEILIEPGNAEQSEIYVRIVSTNPGYVMPPRPMPVLDQEKIDEIRNWIDSGAPYE